jgi:anti-anti-sigma regulatory factor
MKEDAGLQIRLDVTDDTRIIRAEGDLSIATAGALRTELIAGLRPGARTVLDVALLKTVDLAGVQLLCSAHRTYLRHDAAFEFGGLSDALQATALAAGYEASRSVCPYRRNGNCLWKW